MIINFVNFVNTFATLLLSGNFGVFTQVMNSCACILFFVQEVIFFWIIATNDLDMTLKSQVLSDGQTILIGFNQF